MLAEARELLGPGRYEGLSAFDAWLCESLLGDTSNWDDEAGDVDWRYWGCRIGRRVILVDSMGFHYVYRYANDDEAAAMFGDMFADWYVED